MKKIPLLLLVALLAPGADPVLSAPNTREPYIGYLFPAGGRRGTTVRIRAGGQNLRGARKVFVTGEGVSATVVKFGVTGRPLKSEILRELGKQLRQISAQKIAEANRDPRRNRPRNRRRKREEKKPEAEKEPEVELPDHPLLRDLEKMTLRELKKVADTFFDPTRRLQASPQIAESVDIDVVIAADAPPGDRELRILTNTGLSNPMLFQVGTLPETNEKEINDFRPQELPPVTEPFVLNGQVTVRDIDRFRFRARRGQKLVIEVQARRLVPYVADAVPGWFQAVMVLRDAKGAEVGSVDDFRFDPDPVLLFPVPKDGDYELEIRDSIYRGREDFVYRITLGEQPFITQMFPRGGSAGEEVTATIDGWNLPATEILLDTRLRPGSIRETSWQLGKRQSNRTRYAVDDLPETAEMEPNDNRGRAQPVALPRIVNGRIDEPGDVDVFRFSGKAGDEIVAEVCGRRLGSPVDSLVRLTSAAGKVIAWNDDHRGEWAGYIQGEGLVTHHCDSYLRATLPADGEYCVSVADSQGQGGGAFAYRLRISPPRPDFSVIVTPSRLNVPPGSTIPFSVHAVRKDGYDGPIEVRLKDAPNGFKLGGWRIPAGRNHIRMTLTAPRAPLDTPIPVRIEGRARIGEETVTRPGVPAENRMQAFLWRHLVPAEDLLIVLPKRRRGLPNMELAKRAPTSIPQGGAARVRIAVPGLPATAKADLLLGDPPPGIRIRDVGFSKGGAVLVLEADAEKTQVGYEDNLIIEVYVEYKTGGGRNNRGKQQTRRAYLGVLPAIPIVIAQR